MCVCAWMWVGVSALGNRFIKTSFRKQFGPMARAIRGWGCVGGGGGQIPISMVSVDGAPGYSYIWVVGVSYSPWCYR